MTLAAFLAIAAWAEAPERSVPAPSAMKGVASLTVAVGVPRSDSETAWFSAEQLRTDVESRLQKAGIAVAPAAPARLQVVVNASKAREAPLFAFNVEVELVQGMRLGGDAQVAVPVITWRKQALGTVHPSQIAGIEPVVMNLVEQFITAFLEQNPKN
jgi:hypothetical protein